MPSKGQRQPRVCKTCGETDEIKFRPVNASMCKECFLAYMRPSWRIARQKYVDQYPDRILETRTAWAEYNRQYSINLRARNKIEVLTYYGPNQVLQCAWNECTVVDIDMLVLDHVKDNGAEEKRKLGGSSGRGHVFYQYLKAHGFPSGYQTLCCNHNHKKELVRNRAKEPAF
jgi:hypothetical protein